jgi:hypothetical protein
MKKMDYEARARALVGTRFRPQGRGIGGLDCVGVALAVYEISGRDIPADYQPRGAHDSKVREGLRTLFRRIGPAASRPGDLLLMKPAADQFHIGIRTTAGFVHAHAGLRRVVETPGAPEWPVTATYRKRSR